MEIECLVNGAKGRKSSTDARWGAGQVHLGLGWGSVPKAAFAGAEMEQSCSFAAGLLPPGKSMFVLAAQRGPGLGPCQGGWHWLGIPTDWTQ